MYSPEIKTTFNPTEPEDLILEAFDAAKNVEYPLFIHERSDYGYMFETGNFGGYEKYYANDAYLAPLPFDFSQFDNYSGESKISASLFSTDNGNLTTFFNIERDNGIKFTYGIMLNPKSDSPVKELINEEGNDWGMPVSPGNNLRESVYNWLRTI